MEVFSCRPAFQCPNGEMEGLPFPYEGPVTGQFILQRINVQNDMPFFDVFRNGVFQHVELLESHNKVILTFHLPIAILFLKSAKKIPRLGGIESGG